MQFGLHFFHRDQNLVCAGREALPLLQVEQAQHQQQDALVFQQPGLAALVLVYERRRLQRGRVEQDRIAQRREHGPHLVQVVLHIEILRPLVLHAAQQKAVAEQIVCGLFQQFIRFGHGVPPCGASG